MTSFPEFCRPTVTSAVDNIYVILSTQRSLYGAFMTFSFTLREILAALAAAALVYASLDQAVLAFLF